MWAWRGACLVLTRNRHTDAIRTFLQARDVQLVAHCITQRARSVRAACVRRACRVHAACAQRARSSTHTDATRASSQAHGAPPELEIVHVKKGEAKGTQLREGLQEGEVALLVDDSIAELAHPTVALRPDVHRVLFVRAVL